MPLPAAVIPAIKIGAPIIGGMLGGKGGSKSKNTHTNQTSTRNPWGPTQGPLNQIVDFASGLFNNYWPQYPSKGPPGFNPSGQTNTFFDAINDKLGGTDLTNSASSFIQGLLGGGGANTQNPMIDQIFGATGSGSPLFDSILSLGGQGASGIFGNSMPMYQSLLGELMGNPTAGFERSGGFLDHLLQTVASGGSLTPKTSGYMDQVMASLFGDGGVNLDSLFSSGTNNVNYGGMAQINMGQGKDPTDNPYFDSLADSMREEMAETYERTIVPQIDSEYQRAGRYGSGAYQLAQARANEEANEAIGNAINDKLFEAYENERNRQFQAGLGRASSAQGAASSNQQARLQEKSMMLNFLANALGMSGGLEQFGIGSGMDALGLLSGQEQFGQQLGAGLLSGLSGLEQFGAQFGLDSMLGADASNLGYLGLGGQMAGLGNSLLQGDQQYNLGLLNSIPGLENITNSLLLGGLGASGGMDQLGFQGANNQWQFGFDQEMYNNNLPYNMLSQFMNTILPIASQFGTQHTSGTNIQPGVGFMPGAIQGAAGGAKLGQGIGGLLGKQPSAVPLGGKG